MYQPNSFSALTRPQPSQLLPTVLKAAGKRAGVSQVDLAEWLGNTQTFVSKCGRGERRINAVELLELAEALGVPPLGLLGEYLEQRAATLLSKSKKRTAKGR